MAAQAKQPEDVFVVRGEAWALKSGGEVKGACGRSSGQGMYWYAVNPETDEAAQGLKAGVLLYNAGAKKYSFLPLDEEKVGVDDVYFSPDKKRMIVASRMNRYASTLTVYDTATLAHLTMFMGYGEIFFVDDARFAFTLVDENVERPAEAGRWGTSAARYAPGADGRRIVLKGASAKENFAVMGADASQITINVTSVESEKDWTDPDRQKETEITIKVPPAG
jgi:hypothetical protein